MLPTHYTWAKLGMIRKPAGRGGCRMELPGGLHLAWGSIPASKPKPLRKVSVKDLETIPDFQLVSSRARK